MFAALATCALAWAGPAAGATPNDMIYNAAELPGAAGSVSGTNAGAEDGPCEDGPRGVWYRWTAPESGTLRLQARSGARLDVGTQKAPYCAHLDGTRGDGPYGEVFVVGGETRWILISGDETSFSLDYRLIGAAKPANDDFADAERLLGHAGTLRVTNAGASLEVGEPLHAGKAGGRSLWFSWIAGASGRAVFTTAPAELDTLLAVYTGDEVTSLTRIASNDDVASDGSSRVEFVARAGETYRIAVDGDAGAEGSVWRDSPRYERGISLTWNSGPPPPNDAFADAIELTDRDGPLNLSIPATGWTTGASSEPGEPNHTGHTGSASVWFRWTPSESGPANLSLNQIEHRTLSGLLRVYTGLDVSRLTRVPGSDNPLNLPDARWNAEVGTTYHIALDPGLDVTGPYILGLYRAAVLRNDDFADATRLEGAVGAYSGIDRYATPEAGEPAHAGWPAVSSVWFDWTAPADGPVTFDSYRSTARAFAVYTGTSLDRLDPVAANTNGPLTFVAAEGTTYRIAVDDNHRLLYGVVFSWRMGTTPDRIPPTGRVAAPEVTLGSDVSGIVRMSVEAADETAVLHVFPYGSTGWTGRAGQTPLYEFEVDTTLWPDGYGIGLRARIMDMAFNDTTTEESWVRNENYPPTAFAESPDGAVSSSTAHVRARSKGRETIIARQCSLDGEPYVNCDAADSFVYEDVSEGDHVLRVHVVDHSGKRSVVPATAVWTVDRRPVAPGQAPIDAEPPVSSAPFVRVAPGARAGRQTTPVRITFAAADGQSGVGRYDIEMRSGAGAWRRVWSGGVPTRTQQLAPGRYSYRVRAVDRVGNVGAWTTAAAPLRLRTVQETRSRHGGSWLRVRRKSAHGGAIEHSSRRGSWARLDFTGGEVALVSSTGRRHGRAQVWIDSKLVRTIDLYSARSRPRRIAFHHDFGATGRHTLEVRVAGSRNARSSGTRVDVDAFLVVG